MIWKLTRSTSPLIALAPMDHEVISCRTKTRNTFKNKEELTMAVTEEPTRTTGEQEKKSLYFRDPVMDLVFVLTLAKHAFKGSELAECYSAAAQINGGGR